MKTIHGNCETCKWFDDGGRGEDGICRQAAPQVSVYVIVQQDKLTRQTQQSPTITANFPQVGRTCWCGQWAPGLIPMNG